MDFIDKLRDEDRQWAEDREYRQEYERAEHKRKHSIAQQYYIESGCQPYVEKLASYLNSKPGINGAKIYEENGYSGEGYGQNLAWDLHNNTWKYNFSAYARADRSMMIGGSQTRNIPLNEWRSNKQVLMDALEPVWQCEVHALPGKMSKIEEDFLGIHMICSLKRRCSTRSVTR